MVVTMMASAEIVVPEEEKPKAEEAVVTVDGKRKAESEDTICPTKKLKTVNEGFCVFIGNLNKTHKHEEIKTSLVNYLLKESLVVQDIRLHTDRTFAYVDLANEIDMAKALTLNGKKVLDLPMRISKAKVKVKVNVKDDKRRRRAKPTAEQKAAKFDKWLSVTNLPHKATKAEVMGIFITAVDVTFPGGTSGPTSGIAVLHFETKELAEKAMKKKKGKKLRDRVIKINAYRCKNDKNTEAIALKPLRGAPPPTNTLVIKNLPRLESQTKLKKIFKNAVSINVPKDGSTARGLAFVEFKTDKEAMDAMEMARGVTILKKAINVEYSRTKYQPAKLVQANEVLLTTLKVTGLDEKTSEETLATMFEGCTTTRIIRDEKTSTSKGYGFVDFAKKEDCQAAKESMEDCEMNGKKLTLAYAMHQTRPLTKPKRKRKTQPSVQSAEKAKVQPKQKPGSQPEKPVSKDPPSAAKVLQLKRKREIRKKAAARKKAAKYGAKESAVEGAEEAAADGAGDKVEAAVDGAGDTAVDGATAEEAEVQPKQKPGSQPEKPVSKDPPSAAKVLQLKRKRENRKKGAAKKKAAKYRAKESAVEGAEEAAADGAGDKVEAAVDGAGDTAVDGATAEEAEVKE
ncbi:unnamed protein product [Boreogadus saida]